MPPTIPSSPVPGDDRMHRPARDITRSRFAGVGVLLLGRLIALLSVLVVAGLVTVGTQILSKSDSLVAFATIPLSGVIGIVVFTVDANRSATRSRFIKATYLPTVTVVVLISIIGALFG